MAELGSTIRWVATPTAAKHADSGIPDIEVFPSVAEAVAARGEVDVVLNYAPAAQILAGASIRTCSSSQQRA